MADTTPTLPIEVADKYKVRIPRGQPLKRYFSKFGGIIDFSTITLEQAEAIWQSGLRVIFPKEDDGGSSLASASKSSTSKTKTA